MKTSALTYSTQNRFPTAPPRMPANLGWDKAVPNRYVGYYGLQAGREGIAPARREAIRAGRPFYRIEMILDMGDFPYAQRPNLQSLKDTPLIKVDFCRNDLLMLITRTMGLAQPTDIRSAIAKRPGIINKLWMHPKFAHVRAFMVPGDYPTTDKVLFIRSLEDIDEVQISEAIR